MTRRRLPHPLVARVQWTTLWGVPHLSRLRASQGTVHRTVQTLGVRPDVERPFGRLRGLGHSLDVACPLQVPSEVSKVEFETDRLAALTHLHPGRLLHARLRTVLSRYYCCRGCRMIKTRHAQVQKSGNQNVGFYPFISDTVDAPH